MSLASDEAVISRKTSSSAPAAPYAAPTLTGSPASLKLTKLTPFTTLPLLTSRQGITLFVCIYICPLIIISSSSVLYCNKILKYIQSYIPAFLRMELASKNIILLYSRINMAYIFCCCCHITCICSFKIIRMHKINI